MLACDCGGSFAGWPHCQLRQQERISWNRYQDVLFSCHHVMSAETSRLCQHCSEPLTHKWQKMFCGHKCRVASRSIHSSTCVECGEPKKSRKAVRCKVCANKVLSQRQKKNGVNPRLYITEASEATRLANVAKNIEKRKLSGDLAKPKKADCHRRFSQKHCKAVQCFFRDPRNVVHYCKNISAFVWNNKNLFHPKDVEKKIHAGKETASYACNATQGLSKVHRGRCGTWKGWMLIGEREGRERFDLIGRNWVGGLNALAK